MNQQIEELIDHYAVLHGETKDEARARLSAEFSEKFSDLVAAISDWADCFMREAQPILAAIAALPSARRDSRRAHSKRIKRKRRGV